MQIRPEQYNHLISWFESYVSTFKVPHSGVSDGYTLKIEHIREVVQEMRALSQSIPLSEDEQMLAEIIALFHDIGRFEQFQKYGSFFDAKTENHALLGIKVLEQHQVLVDLDQDAVKMIRHSILLHNVKEVPEIANSRLLQFVRLIRDADKLDIFRLTCQHYLNPIAENAAIALDLPDTGEINPWIYEQLLQQKSVDYKQMQSLQDFKLIQLGWVYDLHFSYSFKKIVQEDIIHKIASTLPSDEKIALLIRHFNQYVLQQINKS